MSLTRNIVVLGCSFGGLGTAHYIAKHILPTLQRSQDAKYVLHLIDSSTHFWWCIAAPRQIVGLDRIPGTFVPIMDGFEQYSQLRGSILFHHGTVTHLNKDARKITISLHEGGSEELEYYALVIATGVRSPTAATTLHGNYTVSQQALRDINSKLANAKDVIISGGGPIGVETAGEVATELAGRGKVTLISGSEKLLPVFKPARAAKAQKLLENLGVTVILNTKVVGDEPTEDGKTQITLSTGEVKTCDVYIPAYGVKPNVDFLPENLKSQSGYVQTNPSTLRVDAAGPRVYSVGDVSGVDTGGVMNMYTTIPIVGTNIAHDLLEDANLGNVAEKKYSFQESETQFVPIGPKTGVAAYNGFGVPGCVVTFVKGRDYMVGQKTKFTEGTKFTKM